MKINAYAKVNLALDVVGQMENGYHELDMIMAPIDLYDEIEMEQSDVDSVSCEGMQLPENNTITNMVALLKKELSITDCFQINVKKNIPSQAGLAGGSADAAGVMKGILELEHIELPLSKKLSLAKQIGADVPFCVVNQYARVQGIGENITCLDVDWKFKILLVKPNVGISTPIAFQKWHASKPIHPDLDFVQMAVENKNLDLLVQAMGNALEKPAFEMEPVLLDVKNDMENMGMVRVMMSGSGSSMMGFSIDEDDMEYACKKLKEKYGFAKIVSVG